MPLSTVMQKVKTELDGTVFPNALTYDGTNHVPALQAHITTPIGATISDSPHAFVWGGSLREHRQTMGGPNQPQINTSSGFREQVHRVTITVLYALPHQLSTLDNIFPAIIDTIMEKCRAIIYPVKLNDNLTGRQSTINLIGEDFEMEYGQVYSVAQQRYLRYAAKIVMTVKEVFQQ